MHDIWYVETTSYSQIFNEPQLFTNDVAWNGSKKQQ